MPDPSITEVITALNRKIPGAKCPLCHSEDWGAEQGLFYHRQRIDLPGMSSTSEGLPSVALVCKVCGNTHFISLAILDPQVVG